MTLILDLGLVLLIMAWAWLLGRRSLAPWAQRQAVELHFSIFIALGLTMIVAGLFALATLHQLHPLSIGLLVGASGLWSLSKPSAFAWRPTISVMTRPLLEKILWLYVLIFVPILALSNHLPDVYSLPSGWLPYALARNHGFFVRFDFFNLHLPMVNEIMLSLIAMLRPPEALNLFPFVCGLLSVSAGYALVKHWFGRSTALLAAVLLLTMPLMVDIQKNPTYDMLNWFFTMTGLLAFSEYYRHGKKGLLALAGAFLGMALATKLVVLPLLLTVAVVYLYIEATLIRDEKRSLRTWWIASWIFFLCTTLPMLPWLIKAFINTGNPVWPFAYGIFGGSCWSAAAHQVLFKTWNQAWNPWYFYTTIPQQIAYGMGINPLFAKDTGIMVLALAPWSLLALRHSKAIRFIWSVVAIFLLLLPWLLPHEPSYAFGLYWALALLAAWVIHDLRSSSIPWLRPMINTFVIGNFLLLLALTAYASFTPIPCKVSRLDVLKVSLGLSDRTVYLHHRYPELMQGIDYLEANMNTGEKVMLRSSIPGDFHRDFVIGQPIFQRLIDYDQMSNSAELETRLKTLNIRYILWGKAHPGNYIYLSPKYIRYMGQLLSRSEAVVDNKEIAVYRLPDGVHHD